MTPSEPSKVLPEAEAAERLRQHLEEIARERDRAHRALQERETELARIQRIARVGGVEVDFREGFKNRRSPEYLVIHGLPPDATNETHEDWVNRVHPDDRDHTVKQFLDALAGRDEDYFATYRIVRPNDGQTRWIDVIAKIERDADGRALRLVGAHIDVTERMLAQEKLRESEERFRAIADSAPVPMWVTKLDRTRSFANQAYVDFLG
ncbi:MAG: PAS domain-containing protein, partial [Bradyrhizobium sp.]